MQIFVSIGTVAAFLTVLSFLHFFSILHPSQTAGPIFTLYGLNDVFPRKNGPIGGLERWVVIFGGNIPENSPKMSVNSQFKPKRQNIKITISPKL